MKINDFMEPPKTSSRVTRSIKESMLEDGLAHHYNRSIFRRHKDILKWILDNDTMITELEEKKKHTRRNMIKKIINELPTEENKIRQDLWEEKFCYREWCPERPTEKN